MDRSMLNLPAWATQLIATHHAPSHSDGNPHERPRAVDRDTAYLHERVGDLVRQR